MKNGHLFKCLYDCVSVCVCRLSKDGIGTLSVRMQCAVQDKLVEAMMLE